MEPKWLKKSSKKSEVFLIDFGPIFGGFWEHFGGQNTIKNRVRNLVFFWRAKNESWSRLWRSKGGPRVCGGQQACPGGAPGSPGQRALREVLAPPNPQQPINWWLCALGLYALQAWYLGAVGVAGVVFGGQQAGPKVLRVVCMYVCIHI